MACIYLLNSCGGCQSFDFDITYFYPNIVTPYFMGAKFSVLGLIMSFPPYLRSVKVRLRMTLGDIWWFQYQLASFIVVDDGICLHNISKHHSQCCQIKQLKSKILVL